MLFQMEGGAVFRDGARSLHADDVRAFLTRALKKKLRRNGAIDQIMGRLDTYGHVETTWNFTHKISDRDDHWATIHAWTGPQGLQLQCSGPQAEAVLERVNMAERRSRPHGDKRKLVANPTRRRSRRREKKRERLLEAEASRVFRSPEQKRKKRAPHVRAPISLLRNEVLVPQFRKNQVTWHEAVTAVERIFAVRRSEKRTARQNAARELWDSLERSGFRFAQYKRRGFCLRFDLVDGWRGDITPLTISCTKDNQHETYRRAREHFKEFLCGLPTEARRHRKQVLGSGSLRHAA